MRMRMRMFVLMIERGRWTPVMTRPQQTAA